jgi:GTP-sensing pleiotropic transcriptional regulator CodY
MKIIRKVIGNNNCQNDIKSFNINTTITNDPHEIANTFHDNFLTVTDIVKGNIKKVTMILGKT